MKSTSSESNLSRDLSPWVMRSKHPAKPSSSDTQLTMLRQEDSAEAGEGGFHAKYEPKEVLGR